MKDLNSLVSEAIVCNGQLNKARYALFTDHVEQTVNLARSFTNHLRTGIFLEDQDFALIALNELWKLTDRHDPTRGSTFWTFASPRLRGSMLDALRESDPVSRSHRTLLKEVEGKRLEIEQRTGHPASFEQACFILHISEEKIAELREVISRKFVSLDAPIESGSTSGSESTATHAEAIADPNAEDPSSMVDREVNLHKVEALLTKLDAMERSVVKLYFWGNHPMRVIAESAGLTESRICQILSKALEKLKEFAQRDTLSS